MRPIIPISKKMSISFSKMNSSGNDFILIDNRSGVFTPSPSLVKKICARRTGVGADGILLLEESAGQDFKMRIINADGSEAEMCGNGAGCIARFAYSLGVCKEETTFETLAGSIYARVREDQVRLGMSDPFDLNLRQDLDGQEIHFINTGVPHTVIISDDIEKVDVVSRGRRIRHHSRFQPAGTNVNFIQVLDKNSIKIRTYERGVEDETLACGTGSVAGAVISSLLGYTKPPISVMTKSGEIKTVYFDLVGQEIKNVYLEGKVNLVYEGGFIKNDFYQSI